MITGPTTGAKELTIKEMYVNDEKGEAAKRGDNITLPLEFRIRPSDKLYKIVAVEKPVETI